MELADFSNKKVFLTGHTGFKGTWFIHLLSKLGADVKGYALPPQKDSIYEKTLAHQFCTSILEDIRNRELLKKELIDYGPDIVFHFAAQPLVISSYREPVYTFEVNHLGTIYLLDAVKDLDKSCVVIIVTTDKVYEDQKTIFPSRETDPLGGYDPYSASKATVEIAVGSYRNSFFNLSEYEKHKKSIAVVRAGNVIGGGDTAENRIIPDIMESLKHGKVVALRNPSAVRPWQHVLDALYAYLGLTSAILEKPDDSILNGAWNFGPNPDDTMSVEDLTKLVIASWGNGDYKIHDLGPNVAFKETHFLSLDTTKAKHYLKWRPRWGTKMSVEKTVAWYTEIEEFNEPLSVTAKQIEEFLQI